MNISNANLKNAVIYCRVSTEEQAHEGESLSAQERRCMAYCESKGLSVLKAFIEAGESGRTEDRTQLKKLLSYCFDRTRKVSAVVCLKQDRFLGEKEAISPYLFRLYFADFLFLKFWRAELH